MARVYHFDIVVRDFERASAFYKAAFGWDTQKWDGPMEYWFAITGDDAEDGINGGISVGEPNMTSGQLTLHVDSVDATVDKVVAAGGKLTGEKRAVPGVGWLADVADTEGNVFGLMEEDPEAR